MKSELSQSIQETVDQWILLIEELSEQQLKWKPSDTQWSICQVLVHILEETSFYLKQGEEANLQENYLEKSKNDGGEMMFRENAFPNIQIPGDPNSTTQPKSAFTKEELKALYLNTYDQLISLLNESRDKRGKSRHPGLGYFTGLEWCQFAEMHMRHHFRQRDRILAAMKESIHE